MSVNIESFNGKSEITPNRRNTTLTYDTVCGIVFVCKKKSLSLSSLSQLPVPWLSWCCAMNLMFSYMSRPKYPANLISWCKYVLLNIILHTISSLHRHEITWNNVVNSLAPGRSGCHFKTAIFNLVLLIGIITSSKDNALRWMPRDLTDDKSTLVQVMAWWRHQATMS